MSLGSDADQPSGGLAVTVSAQISAKLALGPTVALTIAAAASFGASNHAPGRRRRWRCSSASLAFFLSEGTCCSAGISFASKRVLRVWWLHCWGCGSRSTRCPRPRARDRRLRHRRRDSDDLLRWHCDRAAARPRRGLRRPHRRRHGDLRRLGRVGPVIGFAAAPGCRLVDDPPRGWSPSPHAVDDGHGDIPSGLSRAGFSTTMPSAC